MSNVKSAIKRLFGSGQDRERVKSKYAKCPKCGLKIRCGDVERHEKGLHHRNRVGK